MYPLDSGTGTIPLEPEEGTKVADTWMSHQQSKYYRESDSHRIKVPEEVSGRSKPPFVLAAFSYASNPDGYRTIHMSCSDLHPQGFAVSSFPVC